MTSLRRSLAALALGAGLMSACSSDEVTRPAATQPIVQGLTADMAKSSDDTVRISFEYDPEDGTDAYFGKHRLVMPAGSVCDPAKSTYGAGEWDKSCTVLKRSIKIQIKATIGKNGYPYVDFHPNLRFVPTNKHEKSVGVYFWDPKAVLEADPNILYCANASGGKCVNEALTDPSLRTSRDFKNGWVWRRIKHFSGYHVVAGRGDDESNPM
jgi:hypothetical protein